MNNIFGRFSKIRILTATIVVVFLSCFFQNCAPPPAKKASSVKTKYRLPIPASTPAPRRIPVPVSTPIPRRHKLTSMMDVYAALENSGLKLLVHKDLKLTLTGTSPQIESLNHLLSNLSPTNEIPQMYLSPVSPFERYLYGDELLKFEFMTAEFSNVLMYDPSTGIAAEENIELPSSTAETGVESVEPRPYIVSSENGDSAFAVVAVITAVGKNPSENTYDVIMPTVFLPNSQLSHGAALSVIADQQDLGGGFRVAILRGTLSSVEQSLSAIWMRTKQP